LAEPAGVEMTGDLAKANELAYDALVQEAGFLRAEALQCIQHVRHLAVQSTYIAGFALPVIAGLVGVDASQPADAVAVPLTSKATFVVVQFICLGVSLTSLAFLRIYVGSFLQIFTFARYFRHHLIPGVKRVVAYPNLELFHWENWLKQHRSKKAAFVGDADLGAEPVLIGLYTLLYGGAFLAISIWQNSFVIPSVIVAIGIGLLTVMTFEKFLRILRDAGSD
jgi:hypothetical protein